MIIDASIDTKIKARLAELGADDDERNAKYLSDQTGLPYVDLRLASPELDSLLKIKIEDAKKYEIAPFKYVNKDLHVAMLSPNSENSIRFLKNLYETQSINMIVYVASKFSLDHVYMRYSDLDKEDIVVKGIVDLDGNHLQELLQGVNTISDFQKKIEYVAENEKKERVSRLIELTMAGAIHFGASDIHIEPEEDLVRFRFRLDGNLSDIYHTDKKTYDMMNSRLKLLSGLKLSSTANAQDGRFSMSSTFGDIEMRVSLVPTNNGESFVMRLLDPRNANVPFESLGMSSIMMRELDKAIKKPFGMVLTTGPTGSGKTTTMYSCLRKVYNPEVKIMTIEDPIEYHMEGVVQTQVEVKKGYTFLLGLRAALRQDPDVIMVGEIRDEDTSKVAAQAALTGHIVLSTLHTNSAAGAIPRFINLGVDAKTLGSSLSFVMAQRLCRKLCPHCKIENKTDEKLSKLFTNILGNMLAENKIVDDFDLTPKVEYKIYIANVDGCDACHMGYKGRVGLFEGIVMNKKIEDISISSGSERDIEYAARDQGIPNMREDGLVKILSGITSFEEVSDVVDMYEV
jgi:type II secretory ATPase GspE/PulE/Tfp pilus assembly ATPase PilB-like protein